jgi:hypothetical protein
MKISIKGFIYHKTAERFIDCFDRYGINENTNKFAVSDGVSKSFFPDIWAELLVEFFLKTVGHINIADIDSYKSIQNEWTKRVSEIVTRPNQKYYVRNFFIQGRPAAATFVGLYFFREDNTFKWEAIALGDSFLFFVPSDVKNLSVDFDKVIYLSSKSDFEFNNFPDFFDSRSIINKGKIKHKRKDLFGGTFYLMTDALAEWFIAEKQEAFRVISEWETQEKFEKSINELRINNLHNDDSTILIINVEEDNSTVISYKDIQLTDFKELLETEKKAVQKPHSESQIIKSESNKFEKPNEVQFDISFQEKDPLSSLDENKIGNVDILRPDYKESNDEGSSLQHTSNINKEKRKIGFWERLVYPFWGYWETNEVNSLVSKNISENKIPKNEINSNPLDPLAADEEPIVNTSDRIYNDDSANNEKKKEEIEKDIKNKKNKSRKKPIDSKNPEEDISSITDKF